MKILLVWYICLGCVALGIGCGEDQESKNPTGPNPQEIIEERPVEEDDSVDEIIILENPPLEAAIRQELGVSERTLTREDLLSLTHLVAGEAGIRELKGIKNLKNLSYLDLSDNQIEDISPLVALPKLKVLVLDFNQITDLSPLMGLRELEILLLDGNQIEDIAPLVTGTLNSLTTLDLVDNPLSAAALNEHIPILRARGVEVTIESPGASELLENSADDVASSDLSEFRLAFASNRGGDHNSFGLYLIDGMGRNLSQVTIDGSFSGGAQWSPDGSQLLFTSNSQVFKADADGRNPVQLTDSFTNFANRPSWSPDGSRILLWVQRGGVRGVFLMDANSGEMVRLISQSDLGGGDEYMYMGLGSTPVWSPDGTKFAFDLSKRSTRSVYVVDLESEEFAPLSSEFERTLTPSWSPDGRRIVFVGERDGKEDIYTVDPDGGNQANLTNTPGTYLSPSWSPSGDRIVFSAIHQGTEDIYVMNADGSGQTRLTSDPGGYMPLWAPDGSAIAFGSNSTGNWDVFVMMADGSDLRNLTHHPNMDFVIAWAPR